MAVVNGCLMVNSCALMSLHVKLQVKVLGSVNDRLCRWSRVG